MWWGASVLRFPLHPQSKRQAYRSFWLQCAALPGKCCMPWWKTLFIILCLQLHATTKHYQKWTFNDSGSKPNSNLEVHQLDNDDLLPNMQSCFTQAETSPLAWCSPLDTSMFSCSSHTNHPALQWRSKDRQQKCRSCFAFLKFPLLARVRNPCKTAIFAQDPGHGLLSCHQHGKWHQCSD